MIGGLGLLDCAYSRYASDSYGWSPGPLIYLLHFELHVPGTHAAPFPNFAFGGARRTTNISELWLQEMRNSIGV